MQDKETLLKQVHAAIAHEAKIDPQTGPIEMNIADGVLTLSGEVADIAAKKRAIGAASAIKEVRGVIDRLRVATTERPGDGATRDAVAKWLMRDIDFQNCAIYARIKGQLETLREAGADSCGSIVIEVNDGVVTLSGHVISLSHKRLSGSLAWWARGCRDVLNRLEVVPAEDDNDDEIADALRLVFECDPYVHADQIGISCRDGVVTLEGVVASDGERRRAEQDAWCLFAVNRVVDHLQVR